MGRETAVKGLGVLLVWFEFFDNSAESPAGFFWVQGCPVLQERPWVNSLGLGHGVLIWVVQILLPGCAPCPLHFPLHIFSHLTWSCVSMEEGRVEKMVRSSKTGRKLALCCVNSNPPPRPFSKLHLLMFLNATPQSWFPIHDILASFFIFDSVIKLYFL